MKFLKVDAAKMSCQTSNTISRTLPPIELPFPPIIKASDIVDGRKPSKVKSKSPNAFLIYRKAYMDQLALSGYNLKMTEVSKLVSECWQNEKEYVKDEYRKIAQDVEIGLNEKRQKTFTYKVVWKNSKSSKYSAYKRKRSQLGSQENKSSAKSRTSTVYQFVPTEFNFKSSTKQDKDIISTPDSKSSSSCGSPEISQTSDFEFNEFNKFNDFNGFINNYQGFNENLGFDQMFLQFTENSTNLNNNQRFILDENLDWYLQSFQNVDFFYFN